VCGLVRRALSLIDRGSVSHTALDTALVTTMSDYRRQFSHRRVVSEGGAAWGYAPLHSVEAGEAAASSPFLSAQHLGSASVTHSRAASFAEHPLPSLHEDSGSSSGRPSMSEEAPRPVEPAELEEAARVHSAASAPQLHDGTRLLQSLVVPPRMCWAFFCLLAAQALVLPLVFSDAVTGDALWGPFARYVHSYARVCALSPGRYTALVERFKVSFDTAADKVQQTTTFLGRHRTRPSHVCPVSSCVP